MSDLLTKMPLKWNPLKKLKEKEVTKEDKEHIKQIVKKVDGYELPDGWLESMDVVKWIDNDTKILVGTYAPLSDREWEFDMVNDTYKLVTIG